VRKKSKVTKTLIAVSFLIGVIAIVTPVLAAGSNRVLFMAMGDDLDINATNLIIGKIEFDKDSGIPSVAQVNFHQKIYDESGEKVYSMMGILKDGLLLTTEHYFFCPIFNVWFVNVWWFMGMGRFKTTDTDYPLVYRNWFPITMPNTEGKFVSAPILMFLSPTAEYCLEDPGAYPPGEHPEVYTHPGGAWVLAAVLCGIIVVTPNGPVELPIGPISYLTRYIEI